jgi:hypothetical protein
VLRLSLNLTLTLRSPHRGVSSASHCNSTLAPAIVVTKGHPPGSAPWAPPEQSLAAWTCFWQAMEFQCAFAAQRRNKLDAGAKLLKRSTGRCACRLGSCLFYGKSGTLRLLTDRVGEGVIHTRPFIPKRAINVTFLHSKPARPPARPPGPSSPKLLTSRVVVFSLSHGRDAEAAGLPQRHHVPPTHQKSRQRCCEAHVVWLGEQMYLLDLMVSWISRAERHL